MLSRFIVIFVLFTIVISCNETKYSKSSVVKNESNTNKKSQLLFGSEISTLVAQMTLEEKINTLFVSKSDSQFVFSDKSLGFWETDEIPLNTINGALSPSQIDTFADFVINQHKINETNVIYDLPIHNNYISKNSTETNYWSPFIRKAKENHILLAAPSIKEYIPLGSDTLETRINFEQKYNYLKSQDFSLCEVDSRLLQIDTLDIGHWEDELNELFHYEGLLFTKTESFQDVKQALLSGMDLIMTNHTVENHIINLKNEIEQKKFPEWYLDYKVAKILRYKKGLPNNDIAHDSLTYKHFMNWGMQEEYKDLLFKNSVCLAANHNKIIPLGVIAHQKVEVITTAEKIARIKPLFEYYSSQVSFSTFGKPINKHAKVRILWIDENIDDSTLNPFYTNQTAKIIIINENAKRNLEHSLLKNIAWVDIPNNSDAGKKQAVDVIFGGKEPLGKLSYSINPFIKKGVALTFNPIRVSHQHNPMNPNMADSFSEVDSLIHKAIKKKIFPGASILVSKNGEIVYDKQFGYKTYQKKSPVVSIDLFDIASITKIYATTLAVMKLKQEGRLNLKDKIKKHLPIDQSPLKNITILELLTHYSKIQPNMPIKDIAWSKKVASSKDCNNYWCTKPDSIHNVKVADNMYLRNSAVDEMWDEIYSREPYQTKKYRYSDVNFNLIQKIIEHIVKMPLDEYIHQNLYAPIGLEYCLFNPLNKFPKSQIVPTENDKKFRNQLIHGTVHDEAASIMGGVGGSAGLFANAQNLAILGQLLINGGTYGGYRFLEPKTVNEFTNYYKKEKRGLGFDKPRKLKYPSYSNNAPNDIFGHTGFTGTCTWVDPKNNLVFVFLTNRIHPSRNNSRFYKSEIRKKIHNVFYEPKEKIYAQLPTYQNLEHSSTDSIDNIALSGF